MMLIRTLCALLFLCFPFLSNTALAIDESKLLTGDQAFPVSVSLESQDMLRIQWDIAEGYYLYKKRMKFSFNPEPKKQLGGPIFPPSSRLNDPAYGDVEVYRHTLVVHYPIHNYIDGTNNPVLTLGYQGCADVGVCYPPKKRKFSLSGLSFDSERNTELPAVNIRKASISDNSAEPSQQANVDNQESLSEQDSIAAKLMTGSFFLTLFSFYGFGLLLSFTPCVFPMIPILSGIIIGQGNSISTRRAFTLSLAYVLSMASAYTVVGVLAALFGTNLQIWFQNPWVLGAFASVFVLLSLSMFGFYELQMPGSIQTKLNSISSRQESGKVASAAIMGLLSALIVGPCVTAPLVGALIYIGQTGDVLLGGSALFSLALGMGTPLLAIGTSAGTFLPKAGEWMQPVKWAFGALMLAVAIWLLNRVIPVTVSQLLWGLLLIVSSIYLGALRQHSNETTQWQLFGKGVGFSGLLYGSLMIVGIAGGTQSTIHPLEGFFDYRTAGIESNGNGRSHIPFTGIKGVDELEQKLAIAKENGQPIMLDFYADWCISCIEMEETTFADKAVITALTNTMTLQTDVTLNDTVDQGLLKHFGIIGPPAILFFDKNGAELTSFRVVGYSGPKKFSRHLASTL